MFDQKADIRQRTKTLPADPALKIRFRGIRKTAIAAILLFFNGSSVRPSGEILPSRSPVNINISKVTIGRANKAGQYRMITFDINWDYSWRTKTPPSNWDAAWVFVKYQVGGGEWSHATLSAISAEHVSPAGMTVSAPSDGKGVFLCRSEDGAGSFHASNVSLRWNYGLDHVAEDAAVNVKVLGLVMAYIFQGSFFYRR